MIAAVLAIGSVVALSGGNEDPAHSQDSQLQQGMHRVDGVLQQGLSKDTHDEIAAKAKDSAIWLQGFGESVKEATE
jgi:hypothetical protein